MNPEAAALVIMAALDAGDVPLVANERTPRILAVMEWPYTVGTRFCASFDVTAEDGTQLQVDVTRIP